MDHIKLSPSGIIFGTLFIGIGILLARFLFKRLREERESLSGDGYAARPTAVGTVQGIPGSKQHWFVRFVNAAGEECLGMDDRFAESVFHAERYHLPKRGAVERVYYWPFEETFDRNSSYYYDGLRAHYWIHFCDDGLYAVSHTKEKRRLWWGLLLAAAFLVAGVLTVLFGE